MGQGHNSEAIIWSAKAARIETGRQEEAAGHRRRKGGSQGNHSVKAGHRGLKAINLTTKGTGNGSYATGTEGDQTLNWYK